MGNTELVPYETIVRATSGDPEAVEEVLRHYSKRIRYAALENGHVNPGTKRWYAPTRTVITTAGISMCIS